jgi:hypothetical protein
MKSVAIGGYSPDFSRRVGLSSARIWTICTEQGEGGTGFFAERCDPRMQSGYLSGRLGEPLNLLGINRRRSPKWSTAPVMYISTLQSMIRAMGGQLKIEAVFPEGKVEINQFRKLKKAAGSD